uniref:Small ribosomal subunit protein uS5c n=1 Tax=Aureoumbra lagunensis TaxID=44058 RepID=C6KIV6_9STRA|nr:30S ribosomal protein S5 [Aureoumbra lagunensis]ACS36912.1 30S ribosomal protein S5 [Aureoumbra lagunensis]
MVQDTRKSNMSNRAAKRSNVNWVRKVVKVRRITKVVKGGKKLRFGALVIVGNEQGLVGVGVGKADDVMEAVKKATNDGKRNLIRVPLTKNSSIPHIVNGQYGACNVLIKPASEGTGVIAGGSVRILLEAAGVQNILAKQLGSNNLLNNARATVCALQELKTL